MFEDLIKEKKKEEVKLKRKCPYCGSTHTGIKCDQCGRVIRWWAFIKEKNV